MSLVRSFLTAALLGMTTAAHAIPFYYVGVDDLQTNATGLVGYPIPEMYSGLPNPNANRLTFLVADLPTPERAHFHAVSSYSYTGPASNPTVQSTYIFEGLAINRVPETGFQPSLAPVPLVPGTGANEGRLVSQSIDGLKYNDLRIQSVQALNGFPAGTTEHYLLNSTNGRWNQSLAGSQVGLQLVFISNGLHIADEAGRKILQGAGAIHPLGPGNNFSFTPTFFTDSTAAPGTYSAEFRFLDQTGLFGESGRFFFDFAVAPEPPTWSLMALGMGMLGLSAWRRQRGM
jgi:hypothetical protein